MSVTTLETAIVNEASNIVGRKLKKKDMMEWRTSEFKAQDGEFLVECPHIGCWACFKGKR